MPSTIGVGANTVALQSLCIILISKGSMAAILEIDVAMFQGAKGGKIVSRTEDRTQNLLGRLNAM